MKGALNVGLIGHKFMGRAHNHALRVVTMFFDLDAVPVMQVLCRGADHGRDLEDWAKAENEVLSPLIEQKLKLFPETSTETARKVTPAKLLSRKPK